MSLGGDLYHLLVGQPPLYERDLSALLRKVQRGEFDRPSQVKKDVPIALEAVCLKAMALSPSDRYTTARQLADDVEQWLADEPVHAYREPISTRLGRVVRRHQAIAAGFTTSLLATMVVLGAGVFMVDRYRSAQRAERAREEARLRSTAEASLLQVEHLQGQARWSDASIVLAEMETNLQDRSPPDLRKKIEESKADLALVSKLDDIRLSRSTTLKGELRLAESDEAYHAAFKAAGLDIDGGDLEVVADKVAESNIEAPLIAALDDWAACTADPKRRDRLLKLARLADPDPWRDRARDPNIWKNPEALNKLLAEDSAAKQSPQLIVAMAYGLKGTQDQQLQLLRKCQRQHPNDFWLNFALGNALAASDTAESLGHYRAALALRPDSAVVMNNLGTALQRQKRYLEAQTAFEQAIAQQPSFVLPHFNLGRVYQDQKQFEKAAREYQETIRLDPKLAQPHNNLGNLLQEQGHPELAKKEYLEAIRLDPKFAQPINNLGNLYREEGASEKAVGEFNKAIGLDSKDASPHVNLGAMLMEKGQLDQAKAEFKKAVELNPNDAVSFSNLGETYRRQKMWKEASEALAKALTLDRENPSIRSNRGLLLADQNKLEDARIEFLAAIRLNPKEAQYFHNLGEVLRLLKRFEEAKAAFESALRIDPKLASVHYDLGQVFRNLSELDKAKAEFRSAIAIDSKLLPAHVQLALVLQDQNLLEEAESAWRKALTLDSQSASLHNSLGKVLCARDRWPDALKEFKSAVALDANDAFIHNNLGLALAMQNDLSAAKAEWALAIKRDPNFADPHNNMGNMLAKQRKLDDAALEYQEAIKLEPKNPKFHENLANLLHAQGKLAQALEEYRKTVDLGRKQTLVAMRACEREASLQKRLPGLLSGDDKPRDQAEKLAFAELCQQPFERRYSLAVRLFTESFEADPTLMDDLKTEFRYHAARAAAGAAFGLEPNAAKPSPQEKAKLRAKAFDWLRTDLGKRITEAKSGRAEDRNALRQILARWQSDQCLAGTRNSSALAAFPEAERSAWQSLWKQVAQITGPAEQKSQ